MLTAPVCGPGSTVSSSMNLAARVNWAGRGVLADLAEATGLTSAYSAAFRPLRTRGTGHDPGRIAADLSVKLADGGKCLTDLAVLRDQPGVFGSAASAPPRPGCYSPTWTRPYWPGC